MTMRPHTPRVSLGHGIAIACAFIVAGAPAPARAAGVVGTGTAASCTDAALDAALAGGGRVTFDCGPAPVTIDIGVGTGTKVIAADTTIDGGGLITISGYDVLTGGSAAFTTGFVVYEGVSFSVRNLAITNCAGGFGGALINHGGTVTISHATFAGNFTGGGDYPGYGSGIYNRGTLTITDSTFADNTAHTAGGSIYNAGTLTVATSTFAGNSARLGGSGAIANGGTLTVTNSTFAGNSAGASGGGIGNVGTLTVTGSTFADNSARGDGGGIGNSGAATVANSTFAGNSATGGGAINNSGSLTVINGTLSGNSATDGANLRSPDGAVLRNTIIADGLSGDECSGALIDGGHNLDSGTSCGFSLVHGSSSDTHPLLDPAGLADNGGPTSTIALLGGSPAIDAGALVACAVAPVSRFDQRGYRRPRDTCSIGAYEPSAAAPTATPAKTATPTPTSTPPYTPVPDARTGDCDGNGRVAIDELILGVNVALGSAPETACPAFADAHGVVDVARLLIGVNNALDGGGIG